MSDSGYHLAVTSGASLYRDAVDLCPSNFTYALNYIHTLETMCDYDAALTALETCLKRNADFTVKRRKALPRSAEDVVSSLSYLEKFPSLHLASQYKSKGPVSISARQVLELLQSLRSDATPTHARAHRHAHPCTVIDPHSQETLRGNRSRQ